jgi:endoglucanase
MRAIVNRKLSFGVLAGTLLVAGCRSNQGTGLLYLSISADAQIPDEAASKLVISYPGGANHVYPGKFPPKDRSTLPLKLQVPNLPASDTPVTFTVQGFDASGCAVTKPATTGAVVIKAGAETAPIAVTLVKSDASCGDGGVPGGPADGASATLDGAGNGTDGTTNSDAGVALVDGSALDSPAMDATKDAPLPNPAEAGSVSDGVDAINATRAEVADAPLGSESGSDVRLGTGGATGTGGISGSGGGAGTGGAATGGATGTGGIATGGATGTGGGTSTGVGTGAGGAPVTGGTTASGGISVTGGTISAGGTTGAGGSSGTGGMPGTGGATAGSSGMRGLTPQQIVKDMFLGWNLGNTFDGFPSETSFGNPETTQAMVQAVADAGFKTMRIPVTWAPHIGAGTSYTIDPAWLDKVEQVVQWALAAGMYAIVNTSRDSTWVILTAAAQSQVTVEVSAVWTQIATRFKNYSDYLIFETFDEPTGPNGAGSQALTALNAYIAAAVTAIRSTSGNNATRQIVIQPYGALPSLGLINALVIPDDPNIIISLHTYYPTGFSQGGSPTTWGTIVTDYSAMSTSLDQIVGWLPNRAIVIGAWGSVAKDDLASRVAHAKAYAQDTTKRGMCPIWWDDGVVSNFGLGLLNRMATPPIWSYPTIVSALVGGATTGSTPGAVDATGP